LPDAVIIVCNFAFAPYTFDEDVVKSLKRMVDKKYQAVKEYISGNFIDIFPEFAKDAGLEPFVTDSNGMDDCLPDISPLIHENYGLFQLTQGCPNSCSFCVGGRQRFKTYPIDKTISYMKELYEKNKVQEFWNWDQNVMQDAQHFETFLDRYAESGINSSLIFALGLQPNLLNEQIIQKIASTKIKILTIPFETGTAESKYIMGKPYTIISAVKKLHLLNKYNKGNLSRIQSSFTIGYPHDDFRSIFRIYLSILNLKSVPLPFPVYIFQNTPEYNKNREKLKNKKTSELHGQLWPLLENDKISEYQNLLQFLLIKNLDDAKQRVSLLTPAMKKAFSEELKVNQQFVNFCLQYEDTPDNLLLIENKISESSQKNKVLLQIIANPKADSDSVSRRLSNHFIKNHLIEHPDYETMTIDLYLEGITFINSEFIDFIYRRKRKEDTSQQTRHLISLTEKYIEKIKLADKIVIAAPMWTMSIPSILKSFFEMVASYLFYYLNEKLENKPVCCILTRDGSYKKEDSGNVQEKSIISAFEFIGVGTNIKFIIAEGLFDKSRSRDIISRSEDELSSFAKYF
jgi:FMN-dependent NADH-azoreductase